MAGGGTRDNKSVKSVKNVLAPEAYRGWLGRWVTDLGVHTAADPVALLAQGLAALGHKVRAAVRGPGGEPLSQLLVLTGTQRARADLALRQVDKLFEPIWRQEPEEGPQEEKPKKSRKNQPRTIWAGWERLPPPAGWSAFAEWWRQGHGSVLVSSSREEVLAQLPKPEATYSHFASRILLLGVQDGRPLGEADDDNPAEVPSPSALVHLRALQALNESLRFAESLQGKPLHLSSEAEVLFEKISEALREPRNVGEMVDTMTMLAERHVLRLAGLYAVVDQSPEIKPEHLFAALAIWDHHEETLRGLFANQTGNKKKDAILHALRERHPAGITTGEINRVVLRGNSRGGAFPILEELEHDGLIFSQEEPAKGRGKRPAERWFLNPEIIGGAERRSFLDVAKGFLREGDEGDPEKGVT